MANAETYFGEKAGVVWRSLSQDGPTLIGTLKKRTKLETCEVYAALGWLARENKIEILGDKPLHYKYALKNP